MPLSDYFLLDAKELLFIKCKKAPRFRFDYSREGRWERMKDECKTADAIKWKQPWQL